jgi:hypothetical protein
MTDHYVGDGCLPGTEPPAVHLRSTSHPGPLGDGILTTTECGIQVAAGLVDNEHTTCPACRQVDRDRTLARGGNTQALDRLIGALGPDAPGAEAQQEIERLLGPRPPWTAAEDGHLWPWPPAAPYDDLDASERAWRAAVRKTARQRAQLATALAIMAAVGCGWLVRAARNRKDR